MNINIIDMIGKAEKIMNKSDKSLKAFSLFTSVAYAALTITKYKTDISSVLPIFALLVRSHSTNDTNGHCTNDMNG